MSGPDDHNYTNLPSGVNNPSSARILSANETPGASQQGEKPKRDLAKLSNLSLLVGIMVFVGSIAFAIQRSQTSTNTRAGTNEDLQQASSCFGPQCLLKRDYIVTDTFTAMPKTFAGKEIPASIMEDAKKAYPNANAEALNRYVTNRVVMYYIVTSELKKKNVSFPAVAENWNAIERNFSRIKKLGIDNLVSTADYDYIQIHFANQLNVAQLTDQYGDSEAIRAKAEELAKKYQEKAQSNPAAFVSVIHEAKIDPVVNDFNNYDLAGYQVKDYYSDLNDVPDQSEYLFDKDFDAILYNLPQGQVSDVITLNKEVPYMYIIVYPKKIAKKDYQSFKELITKYSSQFTQ
jgi:hypothetical protein